MTSSVTLTAAQFNDIIQWDVRTWGKALRYWETVIDWETVEQALELGGRSGGLSLWVALNGKPVICSDLEGVAAIASPLHNRYHVSELVTYEDIDATTIPYENQFDVILFKSILGGIGREGIELQQQVIDQIYKALKPGGVLLFAENLVSSPLHRRLRKRHTSWGSSWRYVTKAEMQGFLHAFSHVEIRTTGFLGTLGRSEQQRRFLSACDNKLFNYLVPSGWHYVSYGMARK